MLSKAYNKLVRDKIPDILKSKGEIFNIALLSDEEYLQKLDEKLNEEVAEYQADKNMEEIADILEVLHAIIAARGYTIEDVEKIREEKKEKRGAFEKKILLKEVFD